jgi:hypothetical protein
LAFLLKNSFTLHLSNPAAVSLVETNEETPARRGLSNQAGEDKSPFATGNPVTILHLNEHFLV